MTLSPLSPRRSATTQPLVTNVMAGYSWLLDSDGNDFGLISPVVEAQLAERPA